MSCDICGRHYHPQRLPFLCAVDARNQLYEPRIAHTVALIHNEQLEAQVNKALGEPSSGSPSTGEHQPSPKVQAETWAAEQQDALDRARETAARAARLRREMEDTRAELDRRRDQLKQRRSDLAAASNGTAARRARVQADVERSIAMTRFKWNQSYEAMAATRGFLCMEASKLYGLRRVKKGSAMRYEIGGFEVVDPYNMNNLPAEVISTSLAHITHILVLACHYLSIRLPAEITLPHRDYPRPTIFSLASSYSHGEVPFPGSASPSSNTVTAAAAAAAAAAASTKPHSNRDLFQRIPRARPLYLDKALPLLSKEDSQGHAMFLEGIALLAYNIAWACCSQGVSIGDRTSFDDTFSIGRNLYYLLIGNQLLNNPAGRIFSTAGTGPSVTPAAPSPTPSKATSNGASDNSGGASAADKAPVPSMGRYAHGTTHTFLGDDTVQTFKLLGPNRLADRLKAKLSSESMMPDWEVLEDDAWAVEDEDHNNMEDGVLNRVVVSPPPNGNGNSNGNGNGRGSKSTARGGTPPSKKAGGASAGNPSAVVVGSRVPEQRLFGVESVATVMSSALDETLANLDLENQSPRGIGGRTPSDRPRNTGTSGWTKLRNRP
ncbi:hypothetical protein HMPREF1624_04451 [Sporothrix schenckii ATCC 58251]|uniref:Autophagy-related protein 14 n=1 Tax=Sporothrix schenckii (strain ATCC 58251 / de Perez 2211183) TaxID=1391915 RepID=U7PUE8_SPOS1|nr:hypothetical protein HMPREF1624_04451 [Sporothrix schenckii ATCC 58251]